MCLETTRKMTKAFRKQNEDKKEITVWKIYLVNKIPHRLEAPYMCKGKYSDSCFQGHLITEPGIVKSNRGGRPIAYCNDDQYFPKLKYWTVVKGIHVCLTKSAAKIHLRKLYHRTSAYMDCVIVPCKAKMKDLVAVDTGSLAVFMKISITPRNFRKAVTGK